MKTVLGTIAILLTVACGGTGGSMSNVASNPTIDPLVAISEAPSRTFDSMLNNVRAQNGAGPVTYDARLGRAAEGHAEDMLQNNFFSHTGSNGSSAGDRIRAEGYNWRTYGENIAWGQPNEEAVLRAWVNSPGHQRNNVNPAFEDFALAKVGGSGSRQYWVLVFATER